jgi:uncharacterized protein YjiS (DUF1127 family)
MSARIAKEELALLMPNALSHYFQDEPHAGPPNATQGRTILQSIAAVTSWLMELPRRRAVLNELGGLSTRELADIGLTREDLPRVFDSGYASRHNSRVASLT